MMFSLALAALLIASVAAAPRVFLDKTGPLLISKGFSTVITFTLDEPIICEDPHVFCGVVVLLTNLDTKSVSINTCQVKWTRDDWFVPRQITVKATENFVDDGQKTILIRTEAVLSASEYYKGFNPADITIVTQSRPTRTCSATGDPHYTTFDGKAWHYYRPGQQVLYKSTVRDFEVQSRLYKHPNWYPALHCGIAAREGNDIVYVNRCPGDTPGIVVNFNSPAGQQPVVTRSGGSYVITFRSGASVQMDDGSLYYNVYLTAPGIDYGHTAGLCGNNNGNPEDDAPGYVIDDETLLFPSQKVTAANDLWAWRPTTGMTAATLPPFAQECNYTAPVISRPVLANGDSEDITDILKSVIPIGTPKPLSGITFDDAFNPGATEKPFDKVEAQNACNAALVTSPLGKACANLPGINVQTYVDNCLIDLELGLGDTRFTKDAVNALQGACSAIAGSDVTTWIVGPDGVLIPNPMIVNQLCPNACNGKGTCNAGTCVCNAGFADVDCSHDLSKPASVSMLSPRGCDAQVPQACPASVQVSGSNFLAGTGATCMFGTTATTLTYVSPSVVLCALPSNSNARTSFSALSVSVSNDGINFSPEPINFVWFDSVCHVCDNTGVCTSNPTSCVIDGLCYRDGVVKEGNPCLTCNAAVSKTAWSYTYTNTLSCGPVFDAQQYTAPILDVTAANTAVVTVHASNQYVSTDPAYKVTYSLGQNSNSEYFKVDATTGVVSTIKQIDPASIDLFKFNSLVAIIATDNGGNKGFSNVFAQLQGTNRPPAFDVPTYTFTVTENVALSTVLGSVHAADPNAGQNQTNVNLGWAVFTYGWILQEANFGDVFAVDANTGVVTVAKAIDYERKASYLLHVRALDGGGQYGTAIVTINVVNVNEAPTNVTLDNTSIDENAASNTVVGVLTSVDPDVGDSATFTLLTANVPFAVSAGKLICTQSLDFETQPHSYSLLIKATDQGGQSTTAPFTINVNDVNEAPFNVVVTSDLSSVTISGTIITIAENFLTQTSFATTSASDVDAGQSVSCVASGTTSFQVSGNKIILIAPLDFETAPTLTFKVACADNGMPSLSSSFVTYTVKVQDTNESGQNVRLLQSPNPVSEDSAAGTGVGLVSAVDPDTDATTLTFATADSDHFFFVGAVTCNPLGVGKGVQCQAQLAVRSGLDFETLPTDIVHVTTIDNHGLSSVNAVSVAVSDSNDAPTGVELTSNRITQGSPDGTVVGTIVVVDQDVTITPSYSVFLVNNAGGRFALKQSSRRNIQTEYQLVVANSSRINAIANPQLTVTLRVDDGTFDNTFDVSITVDPRPIVIVMPATSIAEQRSVGFVFSSVTLDGLDRNDLAPQFSLSGADQSVFKIVADASGKSASLTLLQSVVGRSGQNLQFTITVSFNGVIPSVQKSFTVTVTATNKKPVFNGLPVVYIRNDVSKQSTVVTVAAVDPEGSPVTYSLVSSFSNFLHIDSATGALSSLFVPSSNGLADGDYTATVSASDGIDSETLEVEFSVVDDCYVIPGSNQDTPCGGNGACVDGVAEYTCICDAPYTGVDCQDIQISGGPAANSAASSVSGGAVAGIVVGVIVAVLLVLFIIMVVSRRNQQKSGAGLVSVDAEAQAAVFNNGFMKDDQQTYDLPTHPEGDFEPGLANPMYAWYQPQMSRQECEEFLGAQGEGAFVIRDSSFTPGWHMLGVKTGNQIVHERIKLHQDGTYELLPSTGAHQPNFHVLPQLVDHYAAVKREGVQFSLALDNPIYDNHLLQEAPRTVKPLETIFEADAPVVPIHQHERQIVSSIAASAEEEQELYTNTTEAKVLATAC